MVMAVLILAFFMTLSLNMYFLADNKAERAAFRSEGTSIMGDMDASTTLGYYELFVASEYITKGFVIGDLDVTTPSGIRLPSYIEYFAHKLDSTATTGNAIVINNNTVSGIQAKDREWEKLKPSRLLELWYNSGRSIGGYGLKELKKDSILISPSADKNNFISQLDNGGNQLTSIYNKTVIFPSDSTLNLEKNEFEIIVTRNSELEKKSNDEYTIVSDGISEIKVIKK